MKIFTLLVVAFISFSLSAQPTITSFSPLRANAGSIVTLNGTNFSANTANNIVYFGIVKATVQTASATQLSVVVPTGGSHSFITVTTGGLTAYSQYQFTLVPPGGPNSITPESFTPPVLNIQEQTKGGYNVTMADFDGDGKPDIFATRYKILNIHRNTTTIPGQITFEKGADSPAPQVPTHITTGDLNGDGKLDVVAANYDFGGYYISVWFNTTPAPGSPITFSTKQDISTSIDFVLGVAIHDMNADGKPDIVTSNYDATTDLSVYTNTTTGSTFTYTKLDFPITGGGGARKVTIADFDNDGKPDVAIANTYLDQVHVLRNTTTGANVTFAPKVDLAASTSVWDIASADMNADGKIEIVSLGVNTPRAVSVFRNTSTGVGNINFAARVDFTHPTHYTESVTIHDVDGDSKPDLVTSNYMVKNTSSGETISGEPAVAYEPTIEYDNSGNYLALANDLDGDGVVEIIGFRSYSYGATFYSGILVHDYLPQPRISSISPATARLGETVTITGMHLSTVTSLNFGNASEVTSFTINSNTSITAIVTDATSGNIKVNSAIGSGQIAGFTLIPGPTLNSFSPNSGPVGTVVTLTGTGFSAAPAENRVFFGAARATVTAASTTTLKVIVPAGYSEVPITVSVGIQMASAVRPFRVTFAGGEAPFSEKSMSDPVKIGASVKAYLPAIGDFNNDNKPDMVALGTGGVHVFFNTTANGLVTMSSPLTLTVPSTPRDVSVVDVDGDGKQDIVTSGNSLCVFRNTSTPGTNSFDAAQEFTQLYGNAMAIGDIDGDGRPDIITGNPVAYAARNLSYSGHINFGLPINLPGDFSANSFAIADLNQDGRPEIVMPLTSLSLVNVYPNISTPAILSLLAPIQVTTQELPDFVSVADLDGNNRPEIVVLSRTIGKASAIYNGSTSSLVFSPATAIELGVMPTTGAAALGDINGDNNPDIALSNNLRFVNLMKNTTPTGGAFSFATFSKTTDPSGYAIEKPILVDLDGNGELDVVGGKSTSASPTGTQFLTILRNQTNKPIINSFAPLRAGTGSIVTITGGHLSGVTGVSFGGTPAASFQIISATEITAVLGGGASGEVSVTNGHFTTARSGFTFFNGPIMTSFTPTSASRQESVTITGIQFSSVTAVSFGDVPAASFTIASPTSITAKPASGASGKVKVSNAFGSDELAGFTYLIKPIIDSFTPPRAGTGSIVTITGTDLSVVTGVSFGGTPAASFQIVSDNEITAVLGAGTSGEVSVTDGQFVSARDGFIFFNGPILTSFTPTSASEEEMVTITGRQFTNITAVLFGDVPAASFTVVSPTSITAKPSSGASGKVKVSNSFGSDELSGFTYIAVTGIEPGIASDVYAVEIYPNPSNGNEFVFRLNDAWDGKEIHLVVTDMIGRTVASQPMIVRGENHWAAPAGQTMRAGTYFLSIVFNERKAVRKLIVAP